MQASAHLYFRIFRYSASVVEEYLSGIYLFKVNNGGTRAICEICSKLRIKTDVVVIVSLSILITLNRFHALFRCFHSWLWMNIVLSVASFHINLVSICLRQVYTFDFSEIFKVELAYFLLLYTGQTKFRIPFTAFLKYNCFHTRE